MMLRTIHSRMLAAALVPVALVVLVLVTVLWGRWWSDLSESHSERGQLLARQIALASQYGVLSGNVASLQSVLNAMQSEADVESVAVFDARGVLLARAGYPSLARLEDVSDPAFIARATTRQIDVLAEPIVVSNVQIDDLFTPANSTQTVAPVTLGKVVLEMSRKSLWTRQNHIILWAVGAGALGMLLGVFLAMRLARGVAQPVAHISQRIARIGQGDLSTVTALDATDPLYELQVGLSEMARRLAWSRDDLEQQVLAVTQELRLKKEEAEAATLAKSRFLAAASHDLRQPIHAMGLFISCLEPLAKDEPLRPLVASLQASVRAMQDLLDGLLDLSRLESGTVQVRVGAVKLGTVFDAVQTAIEPIASAKSVRLRVRPTSLWVESDAVLLQRMVMNLVHNAVRYTDAGGTVLIAARRRGTAVHVEVWDSGIGISPEHQSEIFKEFFQVGNPGRSRNYGLGLGLNIVERGAQLLGHTVTLRSALGRGTRFCIAVSPATASIVVPQEAAESSTSVLMSLEGKRVLLLEDDEMALEAVTKLLQSWGLHVNTASTVAQARAHINRGEVPDAIVSDYRLDNGETGLDAIAALRVLCTSEVPACLMSGDTDPELMQMAAKAELTLLHKPVRPAKLRALLRRLLMSDLHGHSTQKN